MIRGRFAPTPSGPLHFGSLIAALGSYLHCKSQDGEWFVRIDDLDSHRKIPCADKEILNTLELFGLYWDGEVVYQSSRLTAYEEAIDQLSRLELVYPCTCSRKKVGAAIYPGTCRSGLSDNKSNHSIRLRTDKKTIKFHDLKQGIFRQNLELDVGDFVIRRADGFVAYHLATAVDDEWQGFTEIVRGADLLDSTPRQIYIQTLLGYTQPEYLHLPIAIDPEGKKLSKTNGSLSIDRDQSRPSLLLCKALNFLGQNTPADLENESVDECIRWGLKNWNIDNVPQEPHLFSNDIS